MVGGQDIPTGGAKRSSLTVRPLPGALGAEIDGVDLSTPLDPQTVQAIREIWLQYLVIFFRDQTLGARELAAFARLFGTPMPYPMVAGVPEEPHVIEVLKREDETVNFGGLWHTDTAYLERPPMGSLLYALEVPQVGGDTLFANGYLAFDALSPGMQAMLEPLRAVNRSDGTAVSATRAPRSGSLQDKTFQAVHPVVRTHPGNGPQGALRERSPFGPFRRHDRRRKRAAAAMAVRPSVAGSVYGPFPVDRRVARLLGQPVRAALPVERLPRAPATHAANSDRG